MNLDIVYSVRSFLFQKMFFDKLRNEILPSTFSSGQSKFVSCEFDNEAVGEDQYASNVVFVKVTVEKRHEKIEIPVVVKREPFALSIRELVLTGLQFYNEVFMYSKMLPFLQQGLQDTSIFPYFHHGIGLLNNPDDNIIILQNLKPLGYRLTKNKVQLDFDHLALAMSKLGQFHALSYVAKERCNEDFFKLASNLEDNFCRKDHKLHNMAKECLHRAIDPLLTNEKYVTILQRFLAKVDNDFLSMLLEIVSPLDPLAVICHGDFCRNNILFKYENGKPVDVRFFDIATSRCASPAIDIAFILFLNSSQELRRNHWNDLLETYHKALSNASSTVKMPSLEDIKESVRMKGSWALVHCSFFLPIVLFGGPVNFDEMTDEEIFHENLNRGGEEGTKILNELVEEMVERRILD